MNPLHYLIEKLAATLHEADQRIAELTQTLAQRDTRIKELEAQSAEHPDG